MFDSFDWNFAKIFSWIICVAIKKQSATNLLAVPSSSSSPSSSSWKTCQSDAKTTVQNPKTLYLLSEMTKKKQQNFTFEKLESDNVWLFCRKTESISFFAIYLHELIDFLPDRTKSWTLFSLEDSSFIHLH